MAKKGSRDEEREDRITMEIVVDAYGPDERAMGWHCHLENQLRFPFAAACVAKRATSPLQVGDKIEVIGMADADDCTRTMFVTIRWKRGELAVPLSQVTPTAETDEETREAVADWHYWVAMGYEF